MAGSLLVHFCILALSWSVQAAITKIPDIGWLMKNRNLFLTVFVAEKSKIRVRADSVSGESLLPDS